MPLKTASSLVCLLLLALAVALAACGGDSSPEQGAIITQTAPAQPPATTATAPPAAGPRTAPRHTATDRAPRTTATQSQTTPTQPQTTATQPQTTPTTTTPAQTTAQRQPRADPQPAASPIDETAQLVLVERISPTHYQQSGTLMGTYSGTMTAESRITAKGVVVDFVATVPGGTIVGRAMATPIIGDSPVALLTGTATITGGTGRFASMRGRGLRVTGKTRLDATRSTVRLSGTVDL